MEFISANATRTVEAISPTRFTSLLLARFAFTGAVAVARPGGLLKRLAGGIAGMTDEGAADGSCVPVSAPAFLKILSSGKYNRLVPCRDSISTLVTLP